MSSIPSLNRAAMLAEVKTSIAEAEVSTSAQAATIMILTKTGYEAAEAVRLLEDDMDALTALRAVQFWLQMKVG